MDLDRDFKEFATCPWASWVPCEKLSLATSIPAVISSFNAFRELVAGPMVQTIFVLGGVIAVSFRDFEPLRSYILRVSFLFIRKIIRGVGTGQG